MSEYSTYLAVRNVLERVDTLRYAVAWGDQGWSVLNSGKIVAQGETASELEQYLNGIEDGILVAHKEMEEG